MGGVGVIVIRVSLGAYMSLSSFVVEYETRFSLKYPILMNN